MANKYMKNVWICSSSPIPILNKKSLINKYKETFKKLELKLKY